MTWLLVLLLGVSPLQGTLAGFTDFSSLDAVDQRADWHHVGRFAGAGQETRCVHPSAVHDGVSHDGSSCQCPISLPALLSVCPDPPSPATVTLRLEADEGSPTDFSSAPFRPPRI